MSEHQQPNPDHQPPAPHIPPRPGDAGQQPHENPRPTPTPDTPNEQPGPGKEAAPVGRIVTIEAGEVVINGRADQ